MTLPTGIVATYDYDAASQITGINYQNGATQIGNLTYTYDQAGNRTHIGGTLARTNLPAAFSAATHNAANQLTSKFGLSLTYDANGNLLTDGLYSYTWDARNRLVALTSIGGLSASFQYDAFGRRTKKTVNGASTDYLYDGLNLARETAGTAPTATYLNGLYLDEQFRRTDNGTGTSNDFLTDALGSVLALTDGTGTVQTSYTYEPFGSTTQAGVASANPVQYTGRENDGTGLYYYRARYYSPQHQRFISSDPIGLAGGLNTYAYVENNPISFVDPYGLRYRPPTNNLPPQNSRAGGGNYKGNWYPNLGTTEQRPGSPFRTPSDRVVRERPEMPPLRDEDLHKALEELPDFREEALKDLLDKIKDGDILRDLDDRFCRP